MPDPTNLGGMAGRPLHFILICDCSGSMGMDGKIQALNTAIREVIPIMQKEQETNVSADVKFRAVKFSTGAQWHIPQALKVADVRWEDLPAGGTTDLGQALALVAEQLRLGVMEKRGLPPVLLLISDGMPTDDWRSGLNALLKEPWGKKAVRLAIAIGQDADRKVLQEFIGNPEIQPFQANTPEQLTSFIRWVSTSVTSSVSEGKGQNPNDLAKIVQPVVQAQTGTSPGNQSVTW
jgi:uncharacterized protein YegL